MTGSFVLRATSLLILTVAATVDAGMHTNRMTVDTVTTTDSLYSRTGRLLRVRVGAQATATANPTWASFRVIDTGIADTPGVYIQNKAGLGGAARVFFALTGTVGGVFSGSQILSVRTDSGGTGSCELHMHTTLGGTMNQWLTIKPSGRIVSGVYGAPVNTDQMEVWGRLFSYGFSPITNPAPATTLSGSPTVSNALLYGYSSSSLPYIPGWRGDWLVFAHRKGYTISTAGGLAVTNINNAFDLTSASATFPVVTAATDTVYVTVTPGTPLTLSGLGSSLFGAGWIFHATSPFPRNVITEYDTSTPSDGVYDRVYADTTWSGGYGYNNPNVSTGAPYKISAVRFKFRNWTATGTGYLMNLAGWINQNTNNIVAYAPIWDPDLNGVATGDTIAAYMGSTGTGSLCVGTTTVDRMFTLYGNNGRAASQRFNSGWGNTAQLDLTVDDANHQFQYQTREGAGAWKFIMALRTDREAVGIGVQNPAVKLEATGGIQGDTIISDGESFAATNHVSGATSGIGACGFYYNAGTGDRCQYVTCMADTVIAKGQVVVYRQGGTAHRIKLCPASGNENEMPIGVALDASGAAGTSIRVAVSGECQILPETGVTAAQGYVILTSISENGRCTQSATGGTGSSHWRELGHWSNTGVGNGVLTTGFLHYN